MENGRRIMNEEASKRFDLIIALSGEIEKKELEVEAAKMELSDLVLKFKDNFTDELIHLSSNPYKGIYYSLRVKKNGDSKVGYICACKKPFGSWLKKAAQ